MIGRAVPKRPGRVKSKITRAEANLVIGNRRNSSSFEKKARKKKRQEVRT